MLVTIPIRPTSPCAMKPVATARTTDQTHRRTTRLSMKARSIGTRGSVMSGATGIPSAVAAPSTLRSLRCRILFCNRLEVALPRRGFVFKQHRRGAVIAADVIDDFFECIRELLALVVRETIEHLQEPLLCHTRRVLQQRTAGASEVQDKPACIARIAVAGDETCVDEPRDDDRDGALIGDRARGELVER